MTTAPGGFVTNAPGGFVTNAALSFSLPSRGLGKRRRRRALAGRGG